MQDFWAALLLIAVGGFLALHCPMAARRELRHGVARGAYGDSYKRGSQPVGFWIVIVLNLFAGLFGLYLLLTGLTFLIW